MAALIARKAELIVAKAEAWETEHTTRAALAGQTGGAS